MLIGLACGGSRALHFPHFPTSARWRIGIRLVALHSEHTRCIRPDVTVCAVAKTKAVKKSKPAKATKPAKVSKPPRPTKPSLPLPPPPPAPPPQRDELAAPRDIGRLLHYGERFGPKKIDVRMLPMQLPVPTGVLAVCDAGTPKTWRLLDRPTGSGSFGVMLSIAKTDGAADELAAIVIHCGRPPITRWTVAHAKGQKPPKSPDQLPRWPITTGWIALADSGTGSPGLLAVPAAHASLMPVLVPLTDGRRALAVPSGDGEYAAYWGIDSTDKPVCLVIDFEVFTQKEWKTKPV